MSVRHLLVAALTLIATSQAFAQHARSSLLPVEAATKVASIRAQGAAQGGLFSTSDATKQTTVVGDRVTSCDANLNIGGQQGGTSSALGRVENNVYMIGTTVIQMTGGAGC